MDLLAMDKKMFYLCDLNKSGGEKKKKSKRGTSSEVSKKSSDSSEKVQTAFSLKDL